METYTQEYLEESFDVALDDLYGYFTVGTMSFYASDILKSCDPIAYREELLNYENTFFSDMERVD